METRYILCIIANDAEYQNDTYSGVGANSAQRTEDAVAWAADALAAKKITWAFGAGTDRAYAKGKTLAAHGEAYLRTMMPDAHTLTNTLHKNYYGTLEEIYWIVKKATQKFQGEKLVFVFFTQERHMRRVKRIVRRQHRGLSAKFVVTSHTKQIPWRDVAKSFVKLRLVEWGWFPPRYKIPY